MGLKSFLFKHSGTAKRLGAEVARLKAANRELKEQVAALKARPPRRPLDSVPALEEALRSALQALAEEPEWARRVAGWPSFASRVHCAVSECDIMLVKATARSYAEAGLSAVACVQLALAEVGKGIPGSLLDFGCGYGRVLRFLCAAFPATQMAFTDMDGEGLGFCAHHFEGCGFRTDLERGPEWMPARFDVIWVGSVLTHLSVADSRRLLRHLADFLQPGGLVVFTTHGERAASAMKAHSTVYRMEPAVLDRIVEERAKTGHGYADYPGWPGYGVSVSTTPWVDQLIRDCGLTCKLHLPAGWAAHQDVFAAQSD